MVKRPHNPPPQPAQPDKAPSQTFTSVELCRAGVKSTLDTKGRYRLQQTGNGKLILTK